MAAATPRPPSYLRQHATRRRRWSLLCTLLLLANLTVPFPGLAPPSASAAVLLSETFANAAASGFLFGGDACLTAGTQGATPAGSIPGCANPPLDPVGAGALRLTQNTTNRFGFVIYNTPIPAGTGLSVTFDQFQYNGTGADGISFFLIDATQATQPTQAGGFGGSLGYAQRVDAGVPGLSAGFVGVGLDAWGNFSNPTEGRQGGVGFSPNAVAVRGAGNGFTGYRFVTKNPHALPAKINVSAATTRTPALRRVKIQISPASVMQVLIDFQDGNGFVPVIPPVDLDHTPGQPLYPSSVKFGFAASSGSRRDFHEIRNLVVATNPPDLTITTTHTGTFAPGTTDTYTLTVANAPAAGTTTSIVTVTDTLPAPVTPTAASGTGWDCAIAGQTVTCSRSDPLHFGATYPPITVSVTVGSQVVPEIADTATVTTADEGNPADNSATDTIVFTADLAIAKDDGQTVAISGEVVTYQIVARNNGPHDAPGATITDMVPASITGVSWTCTGTNGGVCSAPSGTGNAIATTANLPANSIVTYTVTGTLDPAATGTLTNSATIQAPASLPDPNPANNTVTDTDDIDTVADLAITKDDGQTTAIPGTDVTATVVARNTGPSAVAGATIADTVPAALTGVTWTCMGANGGVCGAPSGTGNAIALTANLPVNAEVVLTVSGHLDANASGQLANTATITPPPSVDDPNDANNSATDTDTITPVVDLSVAKSDGRTLTVPGTPEVYTIDVRNRGPSTATNATVTDTVPAAVTGVTWTCAAFDGATCGAPNGTGNAISTTATLPAQSHATYTVSGTVSPTASGTLTNTATASPPAGTTDSNPANNSATDDDTVALTLEDLTIDKDDGVTTVEPGDRVAYAIVVRNNNVTATITNAPFTDPLPATLTGLTWTCTGTNGATCGTGSGTGEINTTITLPPQSSVTFAVTGTVTATATGTLANTATVTVGGSDRAATDRDTITPVADLVIHKSDAQTSIAVGGPPGTIVAYLITVTNDGPNDVTGATIADTVPALLTGVAWTCTEFSGGTCGAASGTGNGIALSANLPEGAAVVLRVTGRLNPTASGSLTNTATVTPPAGMADPDMRNNTATDTDTLARVADLVITKTNAQTDVAAGTPLSFFVTVRNLGPSDVTGASVADTVPATLTGVTWTCTGEGGGVCGTASGTGSIAATVNLPANGVAVFLVTGTLDPAATGILTNTATVTPPSGVTDPDLDNNTTTDSDPILPAAVALTGVVVAPAGGGPLTIKVGEVKQLVTTVTLSNNTTQDMTAQAQWTTSAPDIATVDATGKVLGWSPGSTTVTATVDGVQGTIQVTVIPGIPVGVAPAPAPAGRPSGASAPSAAPGVQPAPPGRTGSATPQPLPPNR